jgi:hypothetical protein
MTLTLCLRPTAGEPRATVKFVLTQRRTAVAVAARHLVVEVGLDDDGTTPAVWIEMATERARPVDVRFELVPRGERVPVGARLVGSVSGPAGEVDVYGSYLGPVSEEN